MQAHELRDYNLLVVGSGFFGLTVAERAAHAGYRVLVIDRRDHLGGNAWSDLDGQTGIEVHRYGSHIFHTSNERVMAYARQFTELNGYEHRVWTLFGGQVYSLPINLHSISQIYGRSISPSEAQEMLASFKASMPNPRNLEEKAIQLVGPVLYEAFFRGYTTKQWETDPRDLPADVITRLPVRTTFDARYFDDTYQGLPVNGYSGWLTAMAHHSLIDVALGTDFADLRVAAESSGLLTVYTGPLDEYFDFAAGPLSWRTIDLEWSHPGVPDFQGTAVMNNADSDVRSTRTHEFKHLHPERPTVDGTVIAREYSRYAGSGDEPYYPVRTPTDRERVKKYRDLMRGQPDVVFGGRLATYQYLDMHMAIAAALSTWDNEVKPRLEERSRH